MDKYDNDSQVGYDEIRTAERGLNTAYEIISELTVRINELEQEITRRDALIESLVSKNEYLRKNISGMKGSTSWKLTKPLRYVSRLKKKFFS